MIEKCLWCNKGADQLNKIEIKFRGKLKEVQVCNSICEARLRRFVEYADTHIKHYTLSLTLSFLIGLVIVFWRFNVDKGALGVLVILAGAGLTLIKYPFVTSQTVSLMGVKKAVVTGRILGAISIILELYFGLAYLNILVILILLITLLIILPLLAAITVSKAAIAC